MLDLMFGHFLILRAFILDSDGQEHTISLAIEHWWISDPASFILQEPGTFFMEALEDSTIARISYEDEQDLMNQYPKFEHYYRIISQLTAVHAQKRLLSNISQKAEERYETFALENNGNNFHDFVNMSTDE